MAIFHHFSKHTRPATVAVLFVFALAGSLVGLVAAQDQDTDDAPTGPLAQQHARSADELGDCASCHPDVVASWQGGPHDLAYSIEHFQQSWGALGNPGRCLECHTTGYSPVTGEFQTEGITCAACHGDAPDDHPPAPVDLNQANRVCSDCHTVTQAEFRASQHAEVGMNCTSCHYAHANGLRMGTELEQCLTCHGADLTGFVAHTTHIESGLSCRDCHGYVQPGFPIPDDGLVPTGHDFQERITACLDCHEDIRLEPVTGDVVTSADPLPPQLDGQRATLRVAQLEAAVQTLLLQNRTQATLNMLQGGAGGLLLGGAVAWLLMRRRSGASKTNGGQDGSE